MRFEARSFVGFDDAGFGGLVEGLVDFIEHGFGLFDLAGNDKLVELLYGNFISVNAFQIPDSSGFALS